LLFLTFVISEIKKNLENFYSFLLTHVGAPLAWGPRMIDTADTGVATPMFNNIIKKDGVD
jgi:hypothetical protein